ncbi:MAG: glycosyltransferase family 2 protein [Lachnospiraceae bacterium]|nr:glycosyltransferase family 2 protein [Lachnospiraceae bacterium]
MSKLITIAVPCYNSAAYMEKCIQSLLVGGEDVEILIVDDGSQKDDTPAIADRLAKEHPTIIRAIHQENKGHGGAVNTGIANATGKYFKVCDSDDWFDAAAFVKIIKELKAVEKKGGVDMLVANYIYDKVGVKNKAVMKYDNALPQHKIFTWKDAKRLKVGQYILMHSVVYRTGLLRESGLQLPEHTFYVDNIFVYYPLPYVKKICYVNVDLYHYFIGREDQSVNESVMISRIDQQLRVNRIMINSYELSKFRDKKLANYMYQYLGIIMTVSSILLVRMGTKESLAEKKRLWQDLKEHDKKMYNKLRYRTFLGIGMNLPGSVGRKIMLWGYDFAQKHFGFN